MISRPIPCVSRLESLSQTARYEPIRPTEGALQVSDKHRSRASPEKPMKKFLLATLAVAALCSSAPCALYALSSGDSPEALVGSLPSPDDVVKILVTKLSLSDTQASTIAPIIADRQQRIKAILADPAAGRMAQRRKAREVIADSDAKITAILTPDQRQGYAAIEHQTREQLKERMRQQ